MRGQCAGARESEFSMCKCRFFTKKSPSRKEKGIFTKIPPQSGDQPRDRDRRRDEEHEDKDDGAVDPVPREPLIARTGEKGENEIARDPDERADRPPHIGEEVRDERKGDLTAKHAIAQTYMIFARSLSNFF